MEFGRVKARKKAVNKIKIISNQTSKSLYGKATSLYFITSVDKKLDFFHVKLTALSSHLSKLLTFFIKALLALFCLTQAYRYSSSLNRAGTRSGVRAPDYNSGLHMFTNFNPFEVQTKPKLL